ncbi:MAG: lipopolysaccharide assembly protein LapA domain-containing protein [Acidimicrobiales bacterium]
MSETRVPVGRVAHAWLSVAAGIVALVVVLVFIIENPKSVPVSFFGATWRISLAVDLLLAAVLGGLVVFLLGTVRILQLRRVAKRRVPAESAAADSAPESAV